MSTTKTKRNGMCRPFVSRWVRRDTIAHALVRVGKLTATEICRVIQHPRAAYEAMRQGQATELHYLELCTAVNVGQAIEDLGVVRGFATIINDARQALNSIETRAYPQPNKWHSPTCYASELKALEEWTGWLEHQLKPLSWGEYQKAYALAESRVLSNKGQCIDRETLA